MSNLAKVDYLERVNRVIDHVLQHLDQPHRLESLAAIAEFSPYHFHRVFKVVTQETLHDFVNRVRLERALMLLSQPEGPSLTEVALRCGFAQSSDFSRAFKAKYGVAPSRFSLEAHRDRGRAELMATVPDGHRLVRLPVGANPDGFEVTLRTLPERQVAYLRVFAPYQGRGVLEVIERLTVWAEPRGLAQGQWLGYQWDDPEVVPLAQCRYDVGLEVPKGVPASDGVSLRRFPEMTVAEVPIVGGIDLEMRALDWLYTTWLPNSGHAPAHEPMFEAWDGRPFAHGTSHFTLRLHLALAGPDDGFGPVPEQPGHLGR